MVGSSLAAVGAAIIAFAVLPNLETFAGFSIVLGAYLIPVGALMAQPWQAAIFAPMAGNLVPLLAPANQMTYDTVQFYNSALAILAGSGVAAVSFRLLPPLSPSLRTRRLLVMTLRDLRRIAISAPRHREDWHGRMYSRIAALPDEAEPLQRAQLVAALTVGIEIIHLRRIAPQLGSGSELETALHAFALGNSTAAIAGLAEFDRRLASLADSNRQVRVLLRTRSRILATSDAIVQHSDYFDEGASN
jgi:uncharacterized membrane protein YccC